jgi:peroxiredoxin
MKNFSKKSIQVIAASADPWEKALQTVERYRLTFLVGYGLNPPEISKLTGAFYNAQENYLHATGFIIGPDGKVEDAVYSTRSVGRLVAQDCLDFIGS